MKGDTPSKKPAAAGADKDPAGAGEEEQGGPGGIAYVCTDKCVFRDRRYIPGERITSSPGEVIPPWFKKA